jgi:hypothetical protein
VENQELHIIYWLENLKGRNHTEDPGEDMRIILKWILKKWDMKMRLDCTGSGDGQTVNTVMKLQVSLQDISWSAE